MKLCILTHLFPARSETFVREHVVGMSRRGHQVTVIARNMDDGITERELNELDELGIKRVYVGQYDSFISELVGLVRAMLRSPRRYWLLRHPKPWSRRELLLALDIVKRIDKCQPDCIHVHFGNLAARIQRVRSFVHSLPPMLATWHGYEANVLPRSLGKDLYHDLFATEALHTVGSQFMQRRLLELGARAEQTAINPMGIDLNKFAFLKRQFKDTAPLRIVSVGRLDEMKGYRFLIDAVTILKQRGVPVRLRVIGEGPLRLVLEQQIEASGVGDWVELLGAVPSEKVVEEMHHAGLFVLGGVEAQNGRIEAQGVVFAEAQATGLPVIASDVGGVSAWCNHPDSGNQR